MTVYYITLIAMGPNFRLIDCMNDLDGNLVVDNFESSAAQSSMRIRHRNYIMPSGENLGRYEGRFAEFLRRNGSSLTDLGVNEFCMNYEVFLDQEGVSLSVFDPPTYSLFGLYNVSLNFDYWRVDRDYIVNAFKGSDVPD